eukprot:TRINITY_DN9124_c0_g1_i2.p1 TRINITY_DN9124_c0_g1~~TRINITY_DN9124_c0_g1_i2.p1  ORF type:complete len:192 (+),score=18.27 TRINITY_DN9124_c0_g1_i2:767-1342(+)
MPQQEEILDRCSSPSESDSDTESSSSIERVELTAGSIIDLGGVQVQVKQREGIANKNVLSLRKGFIASCEDCGVLFKEAKKVPLELRRVIYSKKQAEVFEAHPILRDINRRNGQIASHAKITPTVALPKDDLRLKRKIDTYSSREKAPAGKKFTPKRSRRGTHNGSNPPTTQEEPSDGATYVDLTNVENGK